MVLNGSLISWSKASYSFLSGEKPDIKEDAAYQG